MKNAFELNRRAMLGTMLAGIAAPASILAQDAAPASTPTPAAAEAPKLPPTGPIIGDPRVRGPFPILSTPFLENGEVDYETLAKSAKFVDWAQCHGMIWPQAGDAVDLLTKEEKMKGMTVLAETMKGRKAALCLGVNGKNTADMLDYARHAESLEPAAIISRPPDEGQTEDDLYEYWRELMKIVHRPVIIQTSGGTKFKGKAPSVKLLTQLGEESEFFGYVKEETGPIEGRMKELVAAKPKIKRVMSAMGGFKWLQHMRIGCEGLVTERAVYADILGNIQRAYDAGDFMRATALFSKFTLMVNFEGGLRGMSLYMWQKRGVFKNTLSRNYGKEYSVPEKPIVSPRNLTDLEKEEIDMRLEYISSDFRDGIICPDLD